MRGRLYRLSAVAVVLLLLVGTALAPPRPLAVGEPADGCVVFSDTDRDVGAADREQRREPEDYVFVPNTDHEYGLVRNVAGVKWLLIGKFDPAGNFLDSERQNRNEIWFAGSRAVDLRNCFGTVKQVYEFRSGVLIPGTILLDGNFVPEVGGNIIRFSDYKYSPDARLIWNLPGWFITKAEAAKLDLITSDMQK